MPQQVSSAAASARIVALAADQHGIVSVRQLAEAGIGWERMREREAAGWLRRVHRGVYALAGRPLSWRGRWMAANLACGEDAILSHRHAAALWRILPGRLAATDPIDLTIPHGRRCRVPGLRIHRTRSLDSAERTAEHGIPVTSPVRTILDLATCLGRRELERTVDEAEYRRICATDEVDRALVRHRGRAGTALLAEVLSRRAGPTRTRTELEEMFLALCRERDLPQPLVNAPLLGLTVDFFWPPALVVEVDGGQAHLTRRAFQDDRDRDSLLESHGYTVVRFTWWDVEFRPAVVAQRVRRLLERTR
jgi:very-short-patch-repair endonuclease